MQTGTYISGVGHLALIGWAFLGGVFNTSPPEMEITEVTMISGEAFAALSNTPSGIVPQVNAEQPEAPEIKPETAAPTVPAPETAPVTTAQPEQSTPSAPETAPDMSSITPLPRAQVDDTRPETPDAPPSDAGASLVLNPALPAKSRPAPRVAPIPAAQPAPDAAPDETVRETAQPVPAEEATQEADEATAPPEATTEIVTEAEEAGGKTLAPATSSRPKSRPQRVAAPAPEKTAPEKPNPTELGTPNDAIADAVAAAVSGSAAQQADVPAGPPMTFGEKDALRVSVQQCWNTGALSSEALRVTVTVAVSMNQDGTPDIGTIRQIGAEGGSATAAKQAFEAARRAIIRCGARGYDLPREKYGQWRDIEMVFNPEKMRIK